MSSTNLRDQIAAADLNAAVTGIARGEYSLLLGAGASIGGSGGGRDLTVADVLAREFTEDFALPTDGEKLTLPEAYEAAQVRRTKDGVPLRDYLRHRFTNCEPADWLLGLPEFTWRRIWTLNIDDSVESAFRRAKSRRQELKSINWREPHRDSELDSVQVVHLHGTATDPTSVVFSVAEYFSATTEAHAWHRVFGDHFQERPFIVIGATLRSEYDLAQVVRRGAQSAHLVGRPSLIVLKEFSQLNREFVERNGLIAIEMTAAAFLEQLMPLVRDVEDKIRETTGSPGRVVPQQALVFLEQFTRRDPIAVPRQRRADFYLGYDPTWDDILDGRDAIFGAVAEVGSRLAELRQSDGPVNELQLLHGPWGSGKSTALLRIGREFVGSGGEVFSFNGEYALDSEATIWWLKRRPGTLLLFDRVADYAPEIEALMSLGDKEGVRVLAVGVDREHRVRAIRNAMVAKHINTSGLRRMANLGDEDIRSLISKLEAGSRLGKITRWKPQERVRYFAVESRRQLFVAMSQLEGGPGFVDRLKKEFGSADIVDPLRDLLGLVALAYQFGYALPMGVATNVTGLTSEQVINAIQTPPLDEWLDVSRQGLKLRHRHIAQLVVEHGFGTSRLYSLTQKLAQSLAPLVTRAAIQMRSTPYLIARNLLDAETVQRWMGPATLSWYADLEVGYSWNARYWEQRALAHASKGDLSAARSYAERAVSEHRDGLTLTTLSGIMLRQVAIALEAGRRFDEGAYWEAVENLRDATRRNRHIDDHPYNVFFNHSLRVMELLATRGEIPRELQQEFQAWLEAAERSSLMDYGEYAAVIRRARNRFLRVVVAAGPR